VDQATTAAEKTFSALSHVSPCLEGGRFFVKIGEGIKVIFLQFFGGLKAFEWPKDPKVRETSQSILQCLKGIAISHPFPRRKGSRTKIAWEKYGKKINCAA
jgi:hypothetical protein